MVNYGFGINNNGWKKSKKNSLAKALKELVEDMEGEGQKPYVQVDEPSSGVAIMNISFLTEAFQHDLIGEANKRFQAVMSEVNED